MPLMMIAYFGRVEARLLASWLHDEMSDGHAAAEMIADIYMAGDHTP